MTTKEFLQSSVNGISYTADGCLRFWIPGRREHRQSAVVRFGVHKEQRGAREISGQERDKNRSIRPIEGRLLSSDSKHVPANTGVETESAKPVAMTAGVEAKEATMLSPNGAEKMEAGSGNGVTTAQHGIAGPVSQDIAGRSHRSDLGIEAKQAVDQVAGSEPTIGLHTQNLNHRDEYGRAGDPAPTLLGATPTALEVGMVSGTHGWLKIRAEMEDSVVTASLSARSTVAQEMLHHELPSLTAFLQEERIGGSSLVVRQTSPTSAGDMSHNSEMQRQGGQMKQEPDSRSDDAQTGGNESGWGFGEPTAMREAWRSLGSEAIYLPVMTGGSGGWLNVRV